MSQELEVLGDKEGKVVIDTSAILAVIFGEEGAENVIPFLHAGCLSSVNLSEVATVAVRRGADLRKARESLSTLSIEIIPFDTDQAYQAASLEPFARSHNLSLGDRACIAAGVSLNRAILTADRRWGELSLPVEVRLIR